jgi:hypothetical protein
VGQLLVQLLEEGMLRDGAGRSVSFRNATVIFTHTTPQPAAAGLQERRQQPAALRGGQPQQQVAVASSAARGLHCSSSSGGGGAGHQGHSHAPHGGGSGASSLGMTPGMELPAEQQDSYSRSSAAGSGGGYYSDSPAASAQLLHELSTRVGAVVHFAPLAPAQLHQILDLQLGPASEVAAAMGRRLVVAPELRAWLVRRALEARAGARPLQQLVRQHVVLPLADRLLEADLMLQEGRGGWGAGGGGRAEGGGREVLATLGLEGGLLVPHIVVQ